MKRKCILINPWIYDFAAMNLRSSPLGLLKVAEYMSRFVVDMRLIDCTGASEGHPATRAERKYGTGKYVREVVEKPEIVKAVPRSM